MAAPSRRSNTAARLARLILARQPGRALKKLRGWPFLPGRADHGCYKLGWIP